VLAQTFRAIIHSRMKVAMDKYDVLYPDRDIVLFEPNQDDSRMFFTNVFSYANRHKVCQHAYRTTRLDLAARRKELAPILARHGIRIRAGALADPERHFTEALGLPRRDGKERLRHGVTNDLADALDRLEAWVDGDSAAHG
jgi:hypothetical protein